MKLETMGNKGFARESCIMKTACLSCVLAIVPLITTAGSAKPIRENGNQAVEPFGIHIVDKATGRGVPLVELELVNHARYISDSAGWVAFNEPGLMNSRVFFTVRSHGYEFPKDGFGYAGKTLKTVPGGSATLKLKRLNIAERLCRLTGGGIYRDSVLLGKPVPLREPLLNGQVFGQDTAVAAVYRGRVYWFWGDTDRPSYPLGHFGTAGATAELPINPTDGINYEYFTDKKGFSRPMFSIKKSFPVMVWVGGLAVVPDAEGTERLITHYAVMKSLGNRVEHGLAIFNDSTQAFDPFALFPVDSTWGFLGGHPIHIDDDDSSWLLFNNPWPSVRAPARLDALCDPASYEAFTCLKPGARYAKEKNEVDRDASGNMVWGWKADTDPVSQVEEKEMIAAGFMHAHEARFQLRDALSDKEVLLHAGSVRWNKFRKRWILIGHQRGGGPSNLGEVWYAEADAPTGPWRRAVKIVTHDQYSFYNVVHHDFLDTEDGRFIHFEGTYTASFSGAKTPTPWYDYNQILYRLDLNDPRLKPARE
jgi:hypothetical protein